MHKKSLRFASAVFHNFLMEIVSADQNYKIHCTHLLQYILICLGTVKLGFLVDSNVLKSKQSYLT